MEAGKRRQNVAIAMTLVGLTFLGGYGFKRSHCELS